MTSDLGEVVTAFARISPDEHWQLSVTVALMSGSTTFQRAHRAVQIAASRTKVRRYTDINEVRVRVCDEAMKLMTPTPRRSASAPMFAPTSTTTSAPVPVHLDIDTSVIVVGELVVDLGTRTVTYQDNLVSLSKTEFNLMAVFARNSGVVLTTEKIIEMVWDGYVSGNSVPLYVGYLRRKTSEDIILTKRSVGYIMPRPLVREA